MTVSQSHAVEERVRRAIVTARKEIREVQIHIHDSSAKEADEC